MSAKKMNVSHDKEPLFHITKRDVMPLWKSIGVRVIAIIAAMLICAVVSFIVIGIEPDELIDSMFRGSFGSERKIWKLLKDLAILLCISLAVTPAFRMRFWNIGAEGQVLISALATTACMYYLGGKTSDIVVNICMLIAACAAGALWALMPAFFKSRWGTNETLFTLMMNYVASFAVAYFLIKWTPNGSSSLGQLEHGQLPKLFDNEYMLIIIAVAVMTVALYIYFNYSKHGYEISVVGESPATASYIGINVKKVIVRTMILSGVVCGIAGFLIVGSLDHTVTTQTVGGQGFTAIMVSWLAKFNPLIMVVTSFLLVFLNHGAAQVSQDFDISTAFPSIIIGIILFFIIGCEFFINYKINFRFSGKEKK